MNLNGKNFKLEISKWCLVIYKKTIIYYENWVYFMNVKIFNNRKKIYKCNSLY